MTDEELSKQDFRVALRASRIIYENALREVGWTKFTGHWRNPDGFVVGEDIVNGYYMISCDNLEITLPNEVTPNP